MIKYAMQRLHCRQSFCISYCLINHILNISYSGKLFNMAKYKICNQINQMSLVSQLISGAHPHALMNLGAHTVLINIDPNPSDQMFRKCF